MVWYKKDNSNLGTAYTLLIMEDAKICHSANVNKILRHII